MAVQSVRGGRVDPGRVCVLPQAPSGHFLPQQVQWAQPTRPAAVLLVPRPPGPSLQRAGLLQQPVLPQQGGLAVRPVRTAAALHLRVVAGRADQRQAGPAGRTCAAARPAPAPTSCTRRHRSSPARCATTSSCELARRSGPPEVAECCSLTR